VKSYDIVIPHYNAPKVVPLAAACVRSIREHSSDYRIIWVQNGGNIPASIVVELDKAECVSVIRCDHNLGFVRATNLGLRESDAPFVVLMNNDTEAVPGWLEKLRRPLVGDIGLSGPLTTARRSWQGQWKKKGEQPVTLPEKSVIAFFCAMLRRDVIEKVGILDVGFGLGLGDDDDYCYRAQAAGFRIALVQDLVIPHYHRSTFKHLFKDTQIHSLQQRAVRRLKWKGER